MAQYYNDRPAVLPQQQTTGCLSAETTTTQAHVLSEFDRLRATLLKDDMDDGWAAELRRYLGAGERDVTKDIDLVEWWEVRGNLLLRVANV
jgi:hypothetical protein